ncbi:unnamed protein product [Rotaria sp. Silwood1]|nr:unnamed protein product [Rotaria sp. Silwood1]CAF1210422.1 unnamed protein product [Rotaria sp. Silwood1]CAF3510210.1 unnamed protein product [Rotaria sp. Silwood1]
MFVGVAGLYSGILLAKAGHTVTIYEASNRAGGRILTYRDPKNPSIYMGEFGAMRFSLDVHSYLNTLIRHRYNLKTAEFAQSNANAYTYINGIFTTMREARENPDIFGFNTHQSERGKTPEQLWLNALQPILQTLEQGGWLAVKKQWDSYSIASYLKSVNMSRAAIDYISIFKNYENFIYVSILEAVRSTLVSGSGSKSYVIEGGNDLLTQAMIDECRAIEFNRCSIMYSTPITEIQLYGSNQVRWMTKNGTSNIFDTVIVATTATAAELIKFEKRINFVDKYRALRQVHYSCSTKILLFFNISWWYTQEKLSGGQSVTDLNIRRVFYLRNNHSNGGTILASYTAGLNSLQWQSLSESDAIELTLQQLIQLHKSSSNIRDYFQGGKVQHWCGDPYAHGAFARFIPFQETDLLDQLQASVSNIHFIGEHTTSIRGSVEGAIVSALREALFITAQRMTIFDVIIVGGDPVGLATAVFLSMKKPNLRIAIVDKGVIMNSYNAFDRQIFRQMFNEEYLTELANMSFSLWRQLERLANLSFGSILNTNDGFLLFGNLNTNQSTVADNLLSIKRTYENLQIQGEYLNNTQLKMRYPMFTFSHQYVGIFDNQSGYINVTMLMIALLRIIDQNPNIIIREQEEFLSLKLFNNCTQLITDRGILHASRKVLFIPGSSVENVSHLLNIDLNITLWKVPIYYFRHSSSFTQLPNWLALDEHNSQVLLSGFSIDLASNYLVIKPSFIQNRSNSLIYSSQQTTTIDPFLTKQVVDWVSHHLGTWVNVSDYSLHNQTYFETLPLGNRFLLDFVPRTDNRVLIHAAGLEMNFAPVWADMLSEMILTVESTRRRKYIE